MEVKAAQHKPAPPLTEPVLCKDCQHFTFDTRRFPDCTTPQVGPRDLVFGEPTVRCQDARGPGGKCGQSGRFFIANSGTRASKPE